MKTEKYLGNERSGCRTTPLMERILLVVFAALLLPQITIAQECGEIDMTALIDSESTINELACKVANVLPLNNPPTAEQLNAYCEAGRDAIMEPCNDAADLTGKWPLKDQIDATIVAECTKRAIEKFGPEVELTANGKKQWTSFMTSCKKFGWMKVRVKILTPCLVLAEPWYEECLKNPAQMIEKCRTLPTPTPAPRETPTPAPEMMRTPTSIRYQ